MTHFVRIGVYFRDIKLIVGRINVSYCSPLFCLSVHPLTVTSNVAWHCIYFKMYVRTVLIIWPICPAAGFGQNRKQEVTRYDHVCDVTNELLLRPATSWIR